jgi:hypothetical protein
MTTAEARQLTEWEPRATADGICEPMTPWSEEDAEWYEMVTMATVRNVENEDRRFHREQWRLRQAAGLEPVHNEDCYQETKRTVMGWAEEIRKAFLEHRPCPISAVPRTLWMLDWAFREACVPKECLAANEAFENEIN